MRIACPFCGPRELGEFTYLGDASPQRPTADGPEDAFCDYVYLRDNIAGAMTEYWYHGGGCRAWLKVARNTLTHEISSVEPTAGAGAAKVGAR
jgi:heterotetrameric sarcosine oxidase delta subunit